MSTQKPVTVDEFVASLRHSDLPTIIVEGKEDMPIYRWVETQFGIGTADVLEVGGRRKLLSIFERRQEFPDLPVAFVADKDMWLFSGIPSDYREVIWTEGYSIENDLYAGADLENLLEAEEAQEHQQVLDAIVEWFAFEVEECLDCKPYEVKIHSNRIVPLGQTQIDGDFRKCRGFRPPGEEIHRQIREAYQLKLRGKQLFEMLVRFLSAPDRKSKYSYDNLREMAFKMPPSHSLMNRLMQEIEQAITNQ
ncbi:MAG: DUF4435 domain-containing protein [Caldilineaceae bacterium SB0670_bin_27]|nr:DUF4435 domain-containing protein [Caldilineaceae bacterium SB0670_bin_27]